MNNVLILIPNKDIDDTPKEGKLLFFELKQKKEINETNKDLMEMMKDDKLWEGLIYTM